MSTAFQAFFKTCSVVADWVYKYLVYFGNIALMPTSRLANGASFVIDSPFGFSSWEATIGNDNILYVAMDTVLGWLGLSDIPFIVGIIGFIVMNFVIIAVIKFIATIIGG